MSAKSTVTTYATLIALSAAFGCSHQRSDGNDAAAGDRSGAATDINGMGTSQSQPQQVQMHEQSDSAAGTSSATSQSTDTNVPNRNQTTNPKKSGVERKMEKTRPGTEHDL